MFQTNRCFRFVFLCFFFGPLLGNTLRAEEPDDLVTFDRGGKKGARTYASGGQCHVTPCVITQDGAIKISRKLVERYKVELALIHDGLYRPVHLFQSASTLDKRLSERLFNTRQNRAIFDLSRSIEQGHTDTLFIYGLQLHYELYEGDPIILTFTNREDIKDHRDYYFRYHQEGTSWEWGLALIQPVGIYLNNPDNVVQGSTVSIAVSLSRRVNLDPGKKPPWSAKISHSWRGNLFLGLVNRRILQGQVGDNLGIVNEQPDAFMGVGFTLFDFAIAGIGINLTQQPENAFPFAGVEISNFDQFLRSLKKSTHEKWIAYQEQEKKRSE